MEIQNLYLKSLEENVLLHIPPLLKECEHYYSLISMNESEEDRFFLNASFGYLYKTLFEYDKAYQYFSEAHPFATKYLHSLNVVPFYVVYAKVLNKQKIFSLSVELLLKAKEVCIEENAIEELANIYLELGKNYVDCSLNSKALDYFEQAFEIASRLHKKFITSTILTSIGLVHKNLSQFQISIQYLEKALQSKKDLDDDEGIANVYFELGVVFFRIGNFIKSEEFLHNSIEYSILSNSKRIESNCYFQIGEIYISKSNYDLAYEYFQKALTVSAIVGLRSLLFKSLVKIASINVKKTIYAKAISNLDKAAKIIENSTLFDFHSLLHSVKAELHLALHNWEEYEKELQISQQFSEKDRQSKQNNLNELTDLLIVVEKANLSLSTTNHSKLQIHESLDTNTDTTYENNVFIHLFDQAPLAICITNLDNEILSTNREFLNIFSLRTDELINTNFTNLLSQEYKLDIELHASKLKENPNSKNSVEEQYHLTERKLIWLRRTTSISYIPNYDSMVFIHMLENINERKRAEKELVATLSKMQKNTDLLHNHKRKLETKNEEFSILNLELKSINEQLLKSKVAEQNTSSQLQIQYVEAVSLQNSILPNHENLKSCFNESYVFNKIFDPTGAKKDFHWVYSVPGSTVKYVAVAECSTTGYSATLLSVLGVSLLTSIVYEDPTLQPSMILSKFHSLLRMTLLSNFEKKLYFGFEITLVRIEEDKCIFSGAKLPLYVIQNYSVDSKPIQIDVLKGNQFSIGGIPDYKQRTFTDHIVLRDNPLLLFLTTDGFSNQYNEVVLTPVQRNIKRKLLELSRLSLNDQKIELEEEFLVLMKYSRIIDDILVVAVYLESE